MDAKLRSAIDKIQQDRAKGNHARALKRISDVLQRHPDVIELYHEAVDTSLEAGESLQTIEFLKRAATRFPAEREALQTRARNQASALNDGAVAKYLLEQSIKRRELIEGLSGMEPFHDRTLRDLLQRTRMKRSSLASAARSGHAVTDEITTNLLCDVLLSLRVGQVDPALQTIHEILDANPAEHESLELLLDQVIETHAASASAPAHLALARCRIISARHKDAAEKLVEAARLDPSLGATVLEMLDDAARRYDGEKPEALENAEITVLLITGDHDRAVEHLQSRLEQRAGSAVTVLETIKPFLALDGDVLPLHTLYLDAAVEADRMDEVHEVLQSLSAREVNRATLMEWLDERPKNRFLSADVMILHAELAIQCGRCDHAAEMLRALCATSEAATSLVTSLLKRHRGVDEVLDGLFGELSEGPPTGSESHDVLACDDDIPPPRPDGEAGRVFEHFESTGFRFSPGDGAHDRSLEIDAVEPAPPSIPRDRDVDAASPLDPDFDIYDGSNILGAHAESRGRAPVSTVAATSGGKRPLDSDRAGIIWDEEGEGEESAVDDVSAETPDVAAETPDVTETPVENIAHALYESGAKTFFHVGGDGSDASPQGAEEPPEEDADVTSALERVAVHLANAEPGAALEVLKELRSTDMSEAQRKRMWIETVACHRMMRDFGAAHRTLVQLVDLYPDCYEVEQLAKTNYREYLQDQCTDAPVLVKVTSIDGDS